MTLDMKAWAESLAANWQTIALVAGFVALSWAVMSSSASRRFLRLIEDTIFDNWRLALLATTALLLSLVAGYTTFDGLRNFTGGGLLSLVATIGIQGVMLVTAWLIGESFASGMNQQPTRVASGFSRGTQAAGGAVLGVLLFVAGMLLFFQQGGSAGRGAAAAVNWSAFADKALIFAVGLLAAALVVLYSASDVVRPYIQGGRVILKNIILWVMFLFCMSVSVFFSFDSHFSGIFPHSERVRAAELRAQNQVAGIVADIGTTISTRRLSAAEELFESAGWKAYEVQLANLSKASQGAEKEIEAYFVQQMEARRAAIAQQQERIASAQGGQAGLASKKASLTDELSRLKGERPTLAADHGAAKTELDTRAKAIDAKRVEAMAEDKGVEGTGKEGKGPVYRQRMDELGKMQAAYKIQEDRVKDAQKRLSVVDTRVSQIERELAAVDGDLAKLKGEAQTAEQRIKVAEETKTGEEAPKVDPARVRTMFEKVRADFRQDPTAERLAAVQQQCAQLQSAMIATPATKERVRGIDCDPKQAAEAAAIVFALNSGTETFAKSCAGGDKLATRKTADDLFGFARSCLADSGLPSADTDALRGKINFIELSRDDKAHRFVVSWNAFQDGNRLAYLALAIAITIDSLVFMSGLFGANAVRSPLSDVPSSKARSAQQLEAIIENALLPEKFDNARLALAAMQPITNEAGFMAEVWPHALDPVARPRVLSVLNAGATIHAVAFDEARGRYLVRSELFEFLSIVAKKAFEADKRHGDLAELEQVVSVALLPDPGANAEVVLHYIHPKTEDRGFTGELHLREVEGQHLRTVRSTLNAAATLDRVQRVGNDAAHYYVHKDLYKTLARIRARMMVSASYGGAAQIGYDGQGARDGGRLSASPNRLEAQHGGRQGQLPAPDRKASAATPASDARAAAMPPVPPAGQVDPARMRRDYVASLVAALGLDPASYLDLTEEAFATALAASDTFKHARQFNHALDNALTERDVRAQMSLDDAFTHLESRIGAQDSDARRALRDASAEVDQVWPVLMLLANGPYEQLLDQIVDELEPLSGRGEANSEQHALLSLARRLREALAMHDRGSETGWAKVGAALQFVPSGAERGQRRGE